MDGLQVSVEYYLNRLEGFDFEQFQDNFLMNSSPPSPVNSEVSKYNLLGQINFTSVNLFTSQLMMRIDSMACDLNGSKLTSSINGFAVNSMYAPSATLSCLKASELLNHRIIYFSVMRINFSHDIKEVHLSLTEEIFFQWSPLFHVNVLELCEDFNKVYQNVSLLKSKSEEPNSVAYDNFKRFNLYLKLDGKICFAILLSDEGDTMKFETEYFTVSFHNMTYYSSKCELLSIYFFEGQSKSEVLNSKIEVCFVCFLLLLLTLTYSIIASANWLPGPI